MDYIKIRFGDDFAKLGSEIEKTIEGMFQTIHPMFNVAERKWRPSVDMYETPDAIIVLAELPGVDNEDLEVIYTRKAMRIYGTRSETSRPADARFSLAEIQYGKFERILVFPAEIDREVVSATFSEGILRVHLAKLKLNRTFKIPIEDG